jgi:regulator of sigma E protease
MEFVAAALGKTGTLLVYPVAFLFVLTIVVFVHEYGHFWVGRRCGVGVKAFSIGFGRELFGWDDRHGTRWKISAIPLGGYVKFVGDMNGASVPDDAALARMSPAERAISFHTQPLAQRAAIVAAGPAANFLLAILVFAAVTYFAGRQVLAPRVDTVQAGSAADLAGFRPNDLVISIDGRSISSFADMQRLVSTSAGDNLAFVIERDGRRLNLQATPTVREVEVPGFGKQRMGLWVCRVRKTRRSPLRPLRPARVALGRCGETWSVIDRTMNYLAS